MEFADVEKIVRKPLPWKETVLIPLGDIQLQRNPDAVDMSLLKATIKWGVDHNALWIGMGDLIDTESPSNREALRRSGVYDSVVDALDGAAEELEEELKELLKPTRGRWLGLLEGHHYHDHQDGTTTDTRMAQYLGCPFLGTSAYARLEFAPPEKSRQGKIGFDIWAHHGRGGGGLVASPLNKLEHVTKGFSADLYLMGHTHKVATAKMQQVMPVWGSKRGYLRHKDIHLVSCGSFLKGYVPQAQRGGRAGGLYPERGMLNPLALGAARIWFRPVWKTDMSKSGYPAVDVSVEV